MSAQGRTLAAPRGGGQSTRPAISGSIRTSKLEHWPCLRAGGELVDDRVVVRLARLQDHRRELWLVRRIGKVLGFHRERGPELVNPASFAFEARHNPVGIAGFARNLPRELVSRNRQRGDSRTRTNESAQAAKILFDFVGGATINQF